MTRRTLALVLAVLVVGGLLGGFASGWWSGGHETVAEAAAARLPDDVPAFFRTGGKHLAHFSVDPDRWKNRETNFLRREEEGNHFLDSEDLDGKKLPATHRFDAMKMIYTELKKEPNKVGLLPYAIMENYEKLVVGFYDYRKSPDQHLDPDEVPRPRRACWPTTPATPRCRSTPPATTTAASRPTARVKQKGIHAKIDGFPEKNKMTPEEVCRGLEAKTIDDVWAHVNSFIAESHTHIPKCYELDAAGAFDKPTDESRAFILARVPRRRATDARPLVHGLGEKREAPRSVVGQCGPHPPSPSPQGEGSPSPPLLGAWPSPPRPLSLGRGLSPPSPPNPLSPRRGGETLRTPGTWPSPPSLPTPSPCGQGRGVRAGTSSRSCFLSPPLLGERGPGGEGTCPPWGEGAGG